MIINAAGYSHTSVAILDASWRSKIPVIEVHLSNIRRRDPFRSHSYVSKAPPASSAASARKVILRAVDAIAEILKGEEMRLQQERQGGEHPASMPPRSASWRSF